MKLVPTQDQQDLQTTLRRVLARQCPTTLVRDLQDAGSDGFVPALWAALADVGVFGLAFGEEYGGAGAGLYELGLFFTEAGRVLCPSVVYSTLRFGVAVSRLGSAAQRQRYLPALAAGDLRATIAAWNPGDAGDLRPTVRARPTAGGWTLNGTLEFAANTGRAGVVLLTAEATVFAEPTRTYAFFVDPAADGWHDEPLRTMSGDKQSRVVLQEVFVPTDSVIDGTQGGGVSAQDLRWVANTAVALQCMEMVGGTTAVLEQTVDYTKSREQFGRPIGSFQAAQHIVADIHIGLDGARLAAAQAVWWLGRGEVATRAVAIAKMQCSETYKWATLNAHQLHGGMGYVRETDLHLWSERAKATEIAGGTADVAARWLQKEIGLVS